MFAFEQFLQAHSVFFIERSSLVNVSVGVLVLCASFRLIMMRELSLKLDKTYWLVVILLCYGYASALWSGYGDTYGFQKWIENIPYIIAIVFLAPVLINSSAQMRQALIATLIFGTLVTFALAFGTQWNRREIVMAGSELGFDMRGTPLAVASVGGTIAILAGLLNIRNFPNWGTVKWLIVGLGLIVTFRTESRGQVVATFAAILLFIPMATGKLSKKGIIAGASAVVALAVLAYVIVPTVDLDRWQEKKTTSALEGRMSVATEMLTIYAESGPLTWIVGLGATASYQHIGFYPHNVPIEILTEEGLIGFGLFVFILHGLSKLFWKTIRDPEISMVDRNTVITLLALVAFHVAISLKEGSLYGSQLMFLYIILAERVCIRVRRSCYRQKVLRYQEQMYYQYAHQQAALQQP